LNPRPLGYEPNELPDCSTPRQSRTIPRPTSFSEWVFQIRNPKSPIRNSLVGLGRVELPTSRLSGVRSNQLSYRPILSRVLTRSCRRFQISGTRIFAAKKSHTSLGVRSVLTVDALEGRVASVAIICLRSTSLPNYERSIIPAKRLEAS
jgi:hypothetical protein